MMLPDTLRNRRWWAIVGALADHAGCAQEVAEEVAWSLVAAVGAARGRATDARRALLAREALEAVAARLGGRLRLGSALGEDGVARVVAEVVRAYRETR